MRKLQILNLLPNPTNLQEGFRWYTYTYEFMTVCPRHP